MDKTIKKAEIVPDMMRPGFFKVNIMFNDGSITSESFATYPKAVKHLSVVSGVKV